jgi:type II secretory pathway pseudopilin PulG
MASLTKISQSTPKELSKTEYTGFTVIEIVVAVAIFLIIVPGMFTTLWNAEISVNDIEQSQEALTIAQTALDNIKRQSVSSNFSSIKNYITNDSFYQTTVTITDLDIYTKQIGVVVSWQIGGAELKKVELSALVTDRQSALSGSTCLAVPGQNPPLVNGNLDFGSGNEPTRIIVRNHTAYVATNAVAANLEDFFIVDVTSPDNPTIISKLNTGPGLSGLALAGNTVFAGNTSINGQLQIIDISDPGQPLLKSTYKLPGNYNDNTTITNIVAYSHNTVYLGTPKSQISEFHIIDVTNITTPNELGFYEANAGINAIAVIGSHAFVASPASEELKILDISNPVHTVQVGGFDAPGGSGNGKSLATLGTTVFLGRTIGGKELYILQADTLPITELSKQDLNTSVVSMAAVPSWLFLASTDTAKSLQIWNTSDTGHPLLAKSLALSSKVNALACGRDKLYLATSNGLTIITP